MNEDKYVLDIRSGCCGIYLESRKDESPGLSAHQDRVILYSDKDAKFNGSNWEMDNKEVERFKNIVEELNRGLRFKSLLNTIRVSCGYVGNGSGTTVKIFQDDATGTWVMYSGTKLSVSSDRGFEGVIEEFAKTYKEDEHGELVKIVN
jgi:hypothetical protein